MTKKKERFYRIKWRLLAIMLSIAIVPLLIVVTFSSIYMTSKLTDNSKKYYSTLINQVASNIDFVYEQYARTLTNILKIKNVADGLAHPKFASKQEEIEIDKKIIGDINTPGGLRETVEEKIDGYFFIIELDKESLIQESKVVIHTTTMSNQIRPNEVDNIISDPLFLKLKSDNSLRMVIGKFQKNTLSGLNDTRPVLIYPIYMNPPEKPSDTFTKFIMVLLNEDIMPKFYYDIEDIKYGTLYITDQDGNILNANHPSVSDYYSYDYYKRKYLLEDNKKYDKYEKMSFFEYTLLNTDEKVLNSLDFELIFNDSERENNNKFFIKRNKVKYQLFASMAPTSNCKLIYLFPVYQYYKTIIPVIIYLSVIIVVSAALLVVISLAISGKVTKPIIEIADNLKIITDGNVNVPELKKTQNNEIGILVDGFNQMAGFIRKYTNYLEELVSERTKELLRSNEDLKSANEKLKEQSEFKSKYLANMSHEIRTPLNSMIGNNEYLLRSPKSLAFNLSEIAEEILELIEEEEDEHIKELKEFLKEFNELVLQKSDADLSDFFVKKLINIFFNIKNSYKSEKLVNIEKLIEETSDTYYQEKVIQIKALANANKNGKYLLDLINSVLDISKIEAGKIELTLKKVNLQNFMNDLYSNAVAYQKSKNKERLIITKSIQNIDRESYIFDELKIKQVMLNLISNSIKFTEEGEVIIEVTSRDNYLVFGVKDSGVGIKEEEIGSIFKEFGRTSSTKNIEGTGLGLALSKKLVELHKGKIEMSSVYGKGTNFFVYLPII
ncbi:MAG TPA: ATP-binding protein [Spirochaetota bacterium]|nr:MAG: Virulence sensor protein BvgS precursor [Spirochaetes bacterium ADurb.Bin133]HPY87968.1 ATP-binding protein [Spirochaetota bacterium]